MIEWLRHQVTVVAVVMPFMVAFGYLLGLPWTVTVPYTLVSMTLIIGLLSLERPWRHLDR